MKECGECTVCCSGALIGDAHGHKFGNGIPCQFLSDRCTIYENRPVVCQKYFCAYAQDIIPNLQRPDISGILISVKDGKAGKQFLEYIVSPNGYNMSQLNLVEHWVREQGTYLTQGFSVIKEQEPTDDLERFCLFLTKSERKDLTKEVIRTFSKAAKSFEECNSIAKCYFKNKFYEESIEWCEKCLQIAPSSQHKYTTRYNLCNVLNHANYPEEALEHIKILKQQNPNDIQNYLEEAFAYFLSNKKDQAEETLRYAYNNFDLNYEQATKIRFNLGTYHLYRDEFHTGLKLFLEEGAKLKFWNIENIFNRRGLIQKCNLNVKEWNGDTIPGATILCYAEAGIGDEIINVRFMKEIEIRGMTPVWFSDIESRKDLTELFNSNGFKTVTSLDQLDVESTYYVHSMTLPYKMKLEYADLWNGPYLKCSDPYKQKWERQTETNKRLKIGIRWKGMPDYDQDLHRSVPLKQIHEQVKCLDADFYSLQIDNYEEEINDFPNLIGLHDKLETWHDTFGLIENLDFVITSCTSIAHAAASTGARVFVFVPISAYYTWSHSMKQSPWYGDNVTILRQQRPRVWDEPMEELRLEMKQYE